MPWSARRGCRQAGCKNLAERGHAWCAEHAPRPRYDERRGTAHERGYIAEWRRASREFLKEHPLCAECLREGRIQAAEVVDHIEPHRGNMNLFWDVENWQSLCKTCHNRKTASGR